MIYEFSENNSGGSWWLNESQYQALFDAGWTYEPSDYDIKNGHDKNPFCGGELPYGWRKNLTFEANSIEEAIGSWETATGENFFAEGCNCCGSPFSMSSSDHNEYYSGDSVDHVAVRPF